MNHINITIDGPAGAGKSSAAKALARKMGIIYIDTGAMYRSVALKAIRMGIDTGDRAELAKLVQDIDIKISHSNGEQEIFLDGENVSKLIRTPEVSVGASNVAVIPEVRLKLVELQREIAEKHSVVMDGRDIGTYVLPDAQCKIFLTASEEERAMRRYKEMLEKGMQGLNLEDIRKDIHYRDMNDSSREFAPLAAASDAVIIDSTGMSIEEVLEKIQGVVEKSKLK